MQGRPRGGGIEKLGGSRICLNDYTVLDENGLANFHTIIGDRVHSTIMIYPQGKDC